MYFEISANYSKIGGASPRIMFVWRAPHKELELLLTQTHYDTKAIAVGRSGCAKRTKASQATL